MHSSAKPTADILPFPYSLLVHDEDDNDIYDRIFLLFCGCEFYPHGGWKDFKGNFKTVEKALSYLNSEIDIYERAWFHIVNIETLDVVVEHGLR